MVLAQDINYSNGASTRDSDITKLEVKFSPIKREWCICRKIDLSLVRKFVDSKIYIVTQAKPESTPLTFLI